MSTHCFGSLQVCRIRTAKLTSSGSPDTGAQKGYVSDAIVDLGVSVEIESGDDLVLKNGCGALCQTFKTDDSIKGVNLDMTLCQLDSELIWQMAGGRLMRDLAGAGVGNVIGYELPGSTAATNNGVCLEVWTKAWDSSQQATPVFLGGTTAAYFHWVFPKVRFTLGDTTMENDIMKVKMSGFGEENSHVTANGPFDDWPADVAAPGGITKSGGWFLDSAIPAAACGSITVTSAAS